MYDRNELLVPFSEVVLVQVSKSLRVAVIFIIPKIKALLQIACRRLFFDFIAVFLSHVRFGFMYKFLVDLEFELSINPSSARTS